MFRLDDIKNITNVTNTSLGTRSFTVLSAKDPTRTISLRNAFIRDLNRRFNRLKGLVRESVVDNDCFGIKKKPIPQVVSFAEIKQDELQPQQPIPEKAFEVLPEDMQADNFMNWLETAIIALVLGGTTVTALRVGNWTDRYIEQGYLNGVKRTEAETVKRYSKKQPNLKELLFAAAPNIRITNKLHRDRIAAIDKRVFRNLKGITNTMAAQISRVLSDALAEGVGAEEVARRITNRIDKIGMTRARLLARTEMVKAYNEGKLKEYQRMEDELGETVKVEWWTALDEKVRDTHRERHGKVYTKKQAQKLIGEPNCRCSLLPYIPALEN